ncbi:ArsR/SmtB family transcription factor [Mycobacterium sp. NPDC003323]
MDTFKALADPVRLDLLRCVAAIDEMACTDLVARSNVSKSTVSYHMKALRNAGLIDVRKDGRNYFYRYRSDGLTVLSATLAQIGR